MQGAETGARLAEDHAMPPYPFSKGLHDLGNGCYGYLQPDGGWGLSNAGLIEDQGDTLLVDTLMDLPLTREMLDAMRQAVPAAQTIGTLLNTHSNPAHTRGDVVVYVPQDRVVFAGDSCSSAATRRSGPARSRTGSMPAISCWAGTSRSSFRAMAR